MVDRKSDSLIVLMIQGNACGGKEATYLLLLLRKHLLYTGIGI